MKPLKHIIALLSIAFLLCVGTSQEAVMAASSTQDAEDGTTTSTEQSSEDEAATEPALVDKSQGVTFVTTVSDKGEVSYDGINLNGNSVIITESANSTETASYINIYIDKDGDGIADAGEIASRKENTEVFKNPADTDFKSTMSIYGVYQAKTEETVKITVQSGTLGSLYGVYNGMVDVKNDTEAAVCIDIKNATLGSCSAVAGASVTGGVTVTVQSSTVQGTLNGVAGVYIASGGVATTTASSVTGDVTVTTASSTISAMYIADNGSNVDGKVSLTSTSDKTNVMYVLYNGSRAGKDVVLSVTGGTHSVIYGCSSGSTVIGNLTVTIDETSVVSSCIYGAYGSSIAGNVLIDIYGNPDNSTYLSVYGANYSGSVGGNFDFNYHGGYAGYINVFYGSYQYSDNNYIYPSIGGYAKAVFDKTSVISSNMYVFQYVDIKGDCTVSLAGTDIGYVTAAQGASYGDYMTIGGDYSFTMDEECRITQSYTSYGADKINILGAYKCDIRATVPEDSTSYPYFYGANYTNVGKDTSIQFLNGKYTYVYGYYGNSNSEYSLNGAYTFLIKDCVVNSGIYGAEYLKAKGNIDIDILGISGDSSNSYGYIYALYYSATDGITDINIDGASNLNSLYGIYGNSYSGPDIYNGDATITLKNIDVNGYSYGASGSVYNKNLVITQESVKCGSTMYGASNATVGGNLTVSNTDIGDKEGSACSFYGVTGGTVKGKTDISLTNASFSGNSFYAASGINPSDDVIIKMEGGTIGAEYVTPYSSTSDCEGNVHKTTIDIKGVTFTSAAEHPAIQNYINDNANLVMNIDDKTVIPDAMNINSGYYNRTDKVVENGLSAVATYNNRYYCSGMNIPPQTGSYDLICFSSSYIKLPYDIKAKKIEINSSQLYIPEGVTLESTEEMFGINGSQILLEGKIRGNFSTDSKTGKINGLELYMNGGTVDTNTEGIDSYCYYPVSLKYTENGGTISQSALHPHIHAKDKQFALLGSVLDIGCKPKRGYTLAGAKYKYEGDTSYSQNTTTGESEVNTVISFDIKNKPLEIEVLFKGIQIVAGKTTADPVAKLGNTYTEEKPLYDMASLVISNDSDEGEVKYELQSSNNLPEGLTFKNGKIIGKPTAAYEDGKKVTFKVTGKNGTVANVVLNIIVSEENKTQTSLEGRIAIDDTAANKSINLLGNSVVIEAVSNTETETETNTETAIYLDDNRDGIRDNDTPIARGDYSEYNLYGLSYASAAKPIKVTMTGGKLGNIFVAFNSSISGKFAEDAVSFTMTGGTAKGIYTLYKSQIAGEVYSKIGTDAVKSNYYSNSESTFSGMYTETGNVGQILYGYTVKNDISVGQIGLYSSGVCLTIPKGKTVTVSTLGASYYNNYIYLRGKLVCDNGFNTSNGRILVQDGEVTKTDGTEVTYSKVYYPLTMSTDMEGKKLSGGSNVITPPVDGESVSYGMGGSDITLYADYVAGYSYYYSVNGGEEKESATASITVPMPRAKAEVYVQYVPTNITLKEIFEAPVGYVGTEYTDAKPLYDYGTLEISGDTTAEYGPDVVYELKKGSVLPEGLSLVDGKVIGTPTKAVEEGTPITITVTGRNKTTADITLNYVIKADPDAVSSLDKVEYNTGTFDLNGTSVVVYADPANNQRSKIYLDANHDGIADNSKAYETEDGVNAFYSPTIYGYTDAEKPFEGDISINIKNARVGAVYGIYGTESKKVTVNGNVDIYVRGGSISGVAAGYCGIAKTLSLRVTGGEVGGRIATAAYESEAETANFEFTGTAIYLGSNSNTLSAVQSSTINGNVNCNVGTKVGYGLGSRNYTRYYGVYASTVGGDVIYDINGLWNPSSSKSTGNVFAYQSNITGNMNVKWHTGNLSCGISSALMRSFLTESTAKDLNIIVDENADIGNSRFNGLCDGSVENVNVTIPESVKGTFEFDEEPEAFADVSEINGNILIANKQAMIVKGKYTIAADCTLNSLEVYPDSVVTIAEGVTVTENSSIANYGTIINNGTWNLSSTLYNYAGASFVNNGICESNSYIRLYGLIENHGELTNSYVSRSTPYMVIYDTGVLVNHKDATWNVKARVSNSGIIYNYGNLKQTYNYSSGAASLGKLIAGTTPDYYYADRYYDSTYYPVTLDYTDYCASNVTLTDSTGAELMKGYGDDTNVYLQAAKGFMLKVDGVMDNINLKSVTFNYNGTQKNASTSDSVTWTGTIYYEPVTIKIEFSEIEGAQIITITPNNDVIESIKVGEYNGSFYNAGSKIKVENDTDMSGAYVTFTADPEHPLPDGLYIQQRTGNIYGTPTKASDEPIVSVIKVKGQNQSVANFELTFNKVERGTPTMPVPSVSAVAGSEISTISLPYTYNNGTFEAWVDGTQKVPSEAGEVAEYDAYFRPKDTVNYDWSTVTNGTWDAEKGMATGKIKVRANKIYPEYTAPEQIDATYGMQYKDVELPSDENGKYVWQNLSEEYVGTVGTHYQYIKYVPTNQEMYYDVPNIRVNVVVGKAKAEGCETFDYLVGEPGDKIGDIVLPEVEGGTYQWKTLQSTVVESGNEYEVVYRPDDMTNYDWSEVPGYSNAYKGVVFKVIVELFAPESKGDINISALPIELSADYGKKLSDIPLPKRFAGNWYVNEVRVDKPLVPAEDIPNGSFVWTDDSLVVNKTGEYSATVSYVPDNTERYNVKENIPVTITVVHSHTIVVDKAVAATCTKQGLTEGKHCSVCNEVILAQKKVPALGHAYNKGVVTKKPTATQKGEKTYTCTRCKQTKKEAIPAGNGVPAKKGKVIQAKGVNGKFKVTSSSAKAPKVSYAGPSNKKAKSVSIPAYITVNGVKYEVTAIAANAFKKNKSLTKVTIPKTVTLIGKNAFYSCSKLKTVKFAKGSRLKKIDSKAFYKCKLLRSFVVQSKVTTIGISAFYGCSKLKTITIKSTVLKKVGKNAVKGIYKKAVIKVPKAKRSKYKKLFKKTTGFKKPMVIK